MLKPVARRTGAPAQRGVVLVLALIVLVALTLAALALTRSTYTSSVIAGNLAFQQAATNSADQGVESAIAWLENNYTATTSSTATTCATGSTVLACDQKTWGYMARRQDPSAGQDWQAFWNDNLNSSGYVRTMSADTAGNTVSYVIQRLCSANGNSSDLSNECTVAATATSSSCTGGSSCDSQKVNLNSVSQVYYRITVRVAGPRNTQSFVQSVVAL